MDHLSEIIRVAVDNGLGVASFLVLVVMVGAILWFLFELWKFGKKFMSNHMTHIEKGVIDIASHLGEMKDSMKELREDQREIRQGIQTLKER